MIEHRLKSWPEHFEPVLRGEKRWELRKNDRGFQQGDLLILAEFRSTGVDESGHTIGEFTRRYCRRVVTRVWDIGNQVPGYVVLDIERES